MYNIRYRLNYLRHRFKANNRHGIHSPFVYKLIDTVIYDYRPQKVYREIESVIKGAHSDRYVINTLPFKVYKLIYRLAVYFKPQMVVFAGEKNSTLLTLIKQAMPGAAFFNFQALTGSPSPDMIMIDALTHDITLYLEKSLPHIHDNTMLIFTNIHRTKKAQQAWETLKTDERVHITIDLYYLGLVFFKQGMSKEDFRVRY